MNRKNVEVMVKAGAFDGVGPMHRAQYFYKENDLDTTPTYLDILFRWALRRQESASVSQMSIFDMDANLAEEEHPPVPEVEPWNSIQRCQYEKEVISTYLSGYPLDDYKYEMQYVVNTPVAKLNNLDELAGRDVRFAGMVSGAKDLVSKKGEPFGSMTIDDYSGSYKLSLFGDEYSSFSGFFKDNTFVYVKATIFSRDYMDKSGISRKYTKMRISAMMNLAGVLDRYATKLCFKVGLRDVDEEFCREIERLAKKHSGKVPLQAVVVDPEKSLVLTFNAPKLKVKVHDFLPELEKLEGVFDARPTIVI